MAAITYAYEALACGYATPTQLYQVDLARKALVELDQIRDMADPVNRRKICDIAVTFTRNYLNDGDDEDLDEAIIACYAADRTGAPGAHEALYNMVKRLATDINE